MTHDDFKLIAQTARELRTEAATYTLLEAYASSGCATYPVDSALFLELWPDGQVPGYVLTTALWEGMNTHTVAYDMADDANAITIHRTNEREAGCWIWEIRLDGRRIGWINKLRGTCSGVYPRALPGWEFESDANTPNPLGPGTNTEWHFGARALIVKRLQWMANHQTGGAA